MKELEDREKNIQKLEGKRQSLLPDFIKEKMEREKQKKQEQLKKMKRVNKGREG